MALNFPDSPTLNQIYTDSTSGFSYQWNGSVWISYSASTTSNITELDDISSSFNGVTTTFALTVSGTAVTPVTTNQLLISVGGVMQNPTNDFYISGSNIVFTTAPAAGLTFFGYLLGTALPLTTIADGSVTPVKLSTGGPSWDTDGDVTITGTGTTALLVNGNARVTGILTVGTGSVTINGVTDRINVGSGLTLSSSGITAGVVTATSFVGNSLNVSGVITATTFVGSGSGLTGIITSVNPVGQTTTSVSPTTTIDLSLGSVVYFNHTTNTTVAFANTATTQEITFIRQKDNTATERTITWPTNIRWSNFGKPPGLNQNANSSSVINLLTRDAGLNWYGWEDQSFIGNGVGYLFAFGLNNSGQLGQNNTTYRSSPIQIPGTTWSSVSGGYRSILATKTDGTLWAWGLNGSGQLGLNNRTQYSSPIQIPGTTWSSISNINSFSLATKTDGTLWSWGLNQQGQLGQSNTTPYSSPVQIPGTTWSSINSGGAHSLATKTDGTLWSWGYNAFGQLGQNNRTQFNSPVQIPGTTWSSIDGGQYHTLATKTDGTLWSWGLNQFGQLGQNNRTYASSPVQIPGTTWRSISSGGQNHSMASKTDGTLWVCGYNNQGQLGQNNRINYSSPVQIPGTTWSFISSRSYNSFATKTDGTLWSWGYNSFGQLGQNNTTQFSSPVQIPGTGWSFVGGDTMALQFS